MAAETPPRTSDDRSFLALLWTVVGGFVALAALLVGLLTWLRDDAGDAENRLHAGLRELRVDMSEVETRLRADMREVEERLRADMRDVEERLRADIRESEARLDARFDRIEARTDGLDARVAAVERDGTAAADE